MLSQAVFSNVSPERVVEHFAKAGVPGFAVGGVGYSKEWGVEQIATFTTVTDSEETTRKLEDAADALAQELGEKEYLHIGWAPNSARAILVRRHTWTLKDATGEPLPNEARGERSNEVLDFPVCPNCGKRHPTAPADGNPLQQLLQSLRQGGAQVGAVNLDDPYDLAKIEPDDGKGN